MIIINNYYSTLLITAVLETVCSSPGTFTSVAEDLSSVLGSFNDIFSFPLSAYTLNSSGKRLSLKRICAMP